MAKQRPQPKAKAHPPERDRAGTQRSAVPAAGPSGAISSTDLQAAHLEAVAVYEKGLELLQRHEYGAAVEHFERVLRSYPEERELHERVRLYLNVCRRHATPTPSAPLSVTERLYASTLALNGGRYDEAISHLRLVRDEDPDNDHALYMLAVAHAQRGEHAESVAHLERAISLNPENRALARRDPDLELLREDESFLSALDISPRSRS